ncbi:benzoate 4-monooxygenase cytochrome P450 [Xylaria arbuscula]|nr:benzoate 4-monooxygenase cytochrome P450 [Xylaria arbuscula]
MSCKLARVVAPASRLHREQSAANPVIAVFHCDLPIPKSQSKMSSLFYRATVGTLVSLTPQSWTGVFVTTAVLAISINIILMVVNAFWNLLYHPLARFPGPKLAAISNIPFSYWFLGGRQPQKMLELHLKYGSIVRTAPNELSFNSASSWKDIYGPRAGHQTFIKNNFYDGGSFANRGVRSIISEREPKLHADMRRYLSPAFSDRALGEQEDLISQSIDRFIDLLPMRGDGYDIVKGFEMLTFDIIGDLAFGETFGALESAEPHTWISIILGSLKQGALIDVYKRFPTMGKILFFILRTYIKRLTKDTLANEEMAIELVERRISRSSARKDFMDYLLNNHDEKEVSVIQMAAHASDFVIAGSETTATALATITYYLQRTPAVLKKLEDEVLSAFKSYDEIQGRSTQWLKYLKAVILESLRIYPPVPFPLPRVVPSGGDVVDGHFLPANTIVYVNPLACSMNPRNFSQPDQFIPERWLDQNTNDILDASQPFSLGTRSCIGKSLGLLELRLILAKLIWKYEIEILDDTLDWQRDSDMRTLWEKPKLPVKIRTREHQN